MATEGPEIEIQCEGQSEEVLVDLRHEGIKKINISIVSAMDRRISELSDAGQLPDLDASVFHASVPPSRECAATHLFLSPPQPRATLPSSVILYRWVSDVTQSLAENANVGLHDESPQCTRVPLLEDNDLIPVPKYGSRSGRPFFEWPIALWAFDHDHVRIQMCELSVLAKYCFVAHEDTVRNSL
ncbi:uncharacterized protein B0H18DRAFT_1118061 [Fomitopsis serialis]|uniref:uncharacterized protein n=1 Tax=Fomitopsis serialis TaxID=139415 RepID=UPI0020071E64|nr:uncharacterized protein B0H18DRAFT_1118061 [Neoantrodia serialis]KAH9928388.1 hypothetical protein B0H18DRAFT_1118061 [Neoantrodia serialis]